MDGVKHNLLPTPCLRSSPNLEGIRSKSYLKKCSKQQQAVACCHALLSSLCLHDSFWKHYFSLSTDRKVLLHTGRQVRRWGCGSAPPRQAACSVPWLNCCTTRASEQCQTPLPFSSCKQKAELPGHPTGNICNQEIIKQAGSFFIPIFFSFSFFLWQK